MNLTLPPPHLSVLTACR